MSNVVICENTRIFNFCSLSALEAHDRCFSDILAHGLMMSSSVTAASALMLEDTVLWNNDNKTSKQNFKLAVLKLKKHPIVYSPFL